jgi:hypothetical protein
MWVSNKLTGATIEVKARKEKVYNQEVITITNNVDFGIYISKHLLPGLIKQLIKIYEEEKKDVKTNSK